MRKTVTDLEKLKEVFSNQSERGIKSSDWNECEAVSEQAVRAQLHTEIEQRQSLANMIENMPHAQIQRELEEFREGVATAMNELRLCIARLAVSDFSTDGDAADLVRLDAVLSEINATIATLGLGGTETPL